MFCGREFCILEGMERAPVPTLEQLRRICAQAVALQAWSHVDGDIHHMSFAIEQGAHFEGRRAKGESDLVAVLDRSGTVQLGIEH
jgi:hypothetical protein